MSDDAHPTAWQGPCPLCGYVIMVGNALPQHIPCGGCCPDWREARAFAFRWPRVPEQHAALRTAHRLGGWPAVRALWWDL